MRAARAARQEQEAQSLEAQVSRIAQRQDAPEVRQDQRLEIHLGCERPQGRPTAQGAYRWPVARLPYAPRPKIRQSAHRGARRGRRRRRRRGSSAATSTAPYCQQQLPPHHRPPLRRRDMVAAAGTLLLGRGAAAAAAAKCGPRWSPRCSGHHPACAWPLPPRPPHQRRRWTWARLAPCSAVERRPAVRMSAEHRRRLHLGKDLICLPSRQVGSLREEDRWAATRA